MKSALILLVALPFVGLAQTPAPARSRTQVVLLGTGTPNDDPNRWGPSVAAPPQGVPPVLPR